MMNLPPLVRVRSWRMSALLSLAVFGGCAQRAEPPPIRPIAIRYAEVRQADLAETASYIGTIRSTSEVLVSARIQGTVEKFSRREGERVDAGEVVAVIGALHLEAAAERQRADEGYWSNRLEADRRLAAQGAIAPDQLAVTARTAAAARAALAEAEERLSWTIERAPFAGRVLEWRAEPGQHVLPGQPLLLLGKGAREVQVAVVEEDLRRGIQPGSRALIDARQGPAHAVAVSDISAVARGVGRTYTVRLPLGDGPDHDLRNGQSVAVRFLLRDSLEAAAVPARAVADADGDAHIFLVEGERVRRWPVDLGAEENGWIAVSPAPPAASIVAVTNIAALSDGAAVFAVPDAEARP